MVKFGLKESHRRGRIPRWLSNGFTPAAFLQALLTPEDTILSDELNHASIINSIHLCKTHKYRYLHLDMADLEARLQEAQAGQCRGFQGQIGLILSLLPGEGRLGEAKSIMTNSLQV